MKLRFLGFVQSAGDYVNPDTGECRPFDSVTMDCVTDLSVKGSNIVAQGGQHYKKLKFKTCDCESIFDGAIKKPSELSNFVGKYLYVDGTQYNNKSGQYVQVDEINFVD